MTIDEFGQQIKAKYPQYKDLPDAEVGQKMLAKYPQYKTVLTQDKPVETDAFLSGHPILKGISDLVGTTGLAKGVAQGIFLKYTPEGQNLLKLISQGQVKQEDVEKIIGKSATTREILGSAAQTAFTIASFGTYGKGAQALESGVLGKAAKVEGAGTVVNQGFKKFAGSSAKQALKTGTITGAGSAINTASQEGATGGDVAASFGKGAAVGGVLSLGGSAIKGVIGGVFPKLLKFTSAAPEKVIDRSVDRPAEMAAAQKTVGKIGEQGVLKETQGMVRQLRKDLTNEYQTARDYLVNQFQGARIGLNDKEESLLQKVSDEFGTIVVPDDVKNLSLNEGLNLYKDINELMSKGQVKSSAAGIIVRQLRDVLKNKLVQIGGKVGTSNPISEFFSNYASQKTIFDAADTLVKAYQTGNPKAQSTALSTLNSVFNNNKPAYLDALRQLEAKTGKPILDMIASMRTQDLIPPRTGGFGFDEIFRLMLLPLTSPKLSAAEARFAGRVGQRTAGGLSKGITRIISSKIGSAQ